MGGKEGRNYRKEKSEGRRTEGRGKCRKKTFCREGLGGSMGRVKSEKYMRKRERENTTRAKNGGKERIGREGYCRGGQDARRGKG